MTVSGDHEPILEHRIEIDAPPARVWELVSDVCRMSQWSPQVNSTRLRSGQDGIRLGTQFTNLNSHGDLEWTTHAAIVQFTTERELAFRIEENWVIWSFLLDVTSSGGTRLTQRRTTPEGISELSRELTDAFMGGQKAFTDTLRDGMRQTLERIKATAER